MIFHRDFDASVPNGWRHHVSLHGCFDHCIASLYLFFQIHCWFERGHQPFVFSSSVLKKTLMAVVCQLDFIWDQLKLKQLGTCEGYTF